MIPTAPILVTGATGYIGGRLVPRLLERGYTVRCVARSATKLTCRSWASHANVQIIESDASDAARLQAALQSCGTAYYLIHSMVAVGRDYRDRDRELALTFARAASAAGVRRIIYLGGLGETGDALSPHLSSRREIETALASGDAAVTVLRAAMIIGSGSASFEILRYLVERLPVMITPRWVHTQCQPIAVRDVLRYLVGCLETPATAGRTLDIGGPDVLTYGQLMQTMAERLGLPRRLIIPVPVLTPRLSSLWIHLVTPVSARIARPLAEGLRNRVVCRSDDARQLVPGTMLGVAEAIDAALGRVAEGDIETSWSDAGPIPGDPGWSGGTTFIDRRTIEVAAPADEVFRAVCRIGGRRGYGAADWLWHLRGAMDWMVGGPGLRRGRRDPDNVRFGEALDFWRVTGLDPGRRLELTAEMRLPGHAQLIFEVAPEVPAAHGQAAGRTARSTLIQTARFRPNGLLGLAYWYAVTPLHGPVFRGMLEGIRGNAERAVRAERRTAPAP